jgi:hypothetical protein
MPKIIRQMTAFEVDRFKQQVLKLWGGESLSVLKRAVRFNEAMKQQIEIRLEVLQEIIKHESSKSN